MAAGDRFLDSVLWLVWQLTLLLVLLALLVLLVLVLRRLATELRGERRIREREAARRLILGRLHGDEAELDPAALHGLPAAFLIELIDELSQMVRGEGRERLAALGARLGLVDRLLRALRSWRPGVRAEAARRLAIYRSEKVTRALCAALSDATAGTRVAAAVALVDRDAAWSLLQSRARHDPALAGPTAFAFWQRLAELRPRAFTELFGEPCPPERRVLMLRAAGAAGLTNLVESIAAEAASADPAVRRAATMALLDLKHPLGLDALARMLSDPEPRLRADAVTAAARRRLVGLLGLVRACLEDPDATVRFRAGEAVRRLGGLHPAAFGGSPR